MLAMHHLVILRMAYALGLVIQLVSLNFFLSPLEKSPSHTLCFVLSSLSAAQFLFALLFTLSSHFHMRSPLLLLFLLASPTTNSSLSFSALSFHPGRPTTSPPSSCFRQSPRSWSCTGSSLRTCSMTAVTRTPKRISTPSFTRTATC